MKNALKKIMLTDTDTQPESIIPQWRDDPEFVKWTDKAREISQQLHQAESEQRGIKEDVEQAQQAIIEAKSSLILGEGTESEVVAAESHLENCQQKKNALGLETKALAAAQNRAEQEAKESEAAAKEQAKAIILPLYQELVAGTLANIEAVIESDQAVQDFERSVSQSGLTLYPGSFGSPFTLNSLNIPHGVKDYKRTVEGLLNKTKL